MRYFLIVLILSLAGLRPIGQLLAQQPIEHIDEIVEPPSEVPDYDWTPPQKKVDKQAFDEETHSSLLRELDYSGTPKAVAQERRRRNRSNRNRNRNLNTPDNSIDNNWRFGDITLSNTAFIIIVCLLLAGIIFFFYQYIDLKDQRKTKPVVDNLNLSIEEIQEENLTLAETESLLQRAERLGDFSTAVRLQYLALLKQLQELGMIHYQRDKTDREYRREMDQTELGDVFSEITIDYARNWYGQYPLDRLSYRLVADRFERLRKHLSTKNVPSYV